MVKTLPNGPKGWVHITSCYTNPDQIAISESRLSIVGLETLSGRIPFVQHFFRQGLPFTYCENFVSRSDMGLLNHYWVFLAIKSLVILQMLTHQKNGNIQLWMVFFIGDREQNRATGESEGIECAHFIGDTNAPLLTVLQLPSLSLYSNLFISLATLLLLLSMKCDLKQKKELFKSWFVKLCCQWMP